tara:strand:- start:3565 stop:3747 length:183 start_codon:yes stop_codon:yes gene_type:complete
MEFNKITRSGKANIVVLLVKLSLGIIVILGIIFFLNKIEFPAPKKDIKKIISNEKFKIVK